jgi:hypothetical protein
MIPLQYWLFFVAALRILNVVLGYLGPKYFKERVYTTAPQEGTGGVVVAGGIVAKTRDSSSFFPFLWGCV